MSLTLRTGDMFYNFPNYPDDFVHNFEFYSYLKSMIKERQVKGLIIGYPLHNNQRTPTSSYVEDFTRFLLSKEEVRLPVTFVNEEYTTILARKAVELYQVQQRDFQYGLTNNKKLNDKMAAALILEKFLDFYNEDPEEEEEGFDQQEKEEYRHFFKKQ